MKTTGTIMKSKSQHLLLISFAFIAVFFITCVNTAVMAQTGAVISSVTVSDDTPEYGDQITATINIDMSGVNAPDNELGSYTGTLAWNSAILAYESNSGAPPSGFSGVVNTTNASAGQITFNGANSSGATGNVIVLNVTFAVAGSGTCPLDLSYSAMAAASTFNSLAGILSVNDDELTATGSASGIVSLDGAVSSGTADDVSSISIPHTTGTGSNRLMLVGVSWNCGTADRTISSVTFTPSGGTAVAFTKVITQLGYSTSNPRYSAIYSLVNPPSGQTGTVTIDFNGSVSNGILAGVANFAGVNQTLPLGTPFGANAQSANISISLTGLTGNELIFDNAFLGSSSDTYTLTPGANQTQLWNPAYVANIRSAASTKQATGSSVTMSWTASNSSYWAIAAVPVIPVGSLGNVYNLLLGRPTNHSITINAILEMEGDVYYEYGTSSGVYTSGQTTAQHAVAGAPVETVITGLTTNTEYFYRLKFLPSGSSTWGSGTEYSFHTQRADNATFTFTLISDSHLGQTFSNNSAERYNQTTLNVAADKPDFHLDLGDAFIMEETENQTEANAVYQAQRNYFGNFSHSAPVFLAIGNHENEEGWNLDDTPFSTGIGSIIARKKYFLNPVPDVFYTGDDSLLLGVGGDQLREDYYAWEWGDALFVVLDPFQYTMNLPYSNVTGSGEANDETVSGDQWNWTLGKKQYNWLKQTLENSPARYKFVFSHHVTGGQLTISNSSAGPATYVRGGAMAANYFEWGGLNANGTEEFGSKRAGWNGDPVHQLLVENNVTAYFHGHDHQFVHEEIDGVVYQLVPTPGMEGYGFDLYDSSPYAQSGGNLPDPGHIRVTVAPEEALLEYVRSETGGGGINGQIAYSYTMEPVIPESSITVTSPNGSENWHTGSDHAVTWTSTGVSGNIHIEYSTNNGTSWTDIVSSTENDGSYVWTIPNIPSTSCLVRVSELDGNPVDMSNAVFEIYNLPEHHFIPVTPVNNGYDHMNFYALTAKISGEDLQPGDEIGIFDNSVCVGAGEITQILDGQDIYLPIKISRDDPDVSGIDGYTAGNQVSFRLWDESEEREISAFSITYESGDGVFTPGASSWYYINGETSQEQLIELQSGWNIFSLYVTPENINLMSIVRPLIEADRLIKVQDETGEAIEKNPVTHNWFNDIGDWGVTEGYKINVSVDTVLNVAGSPVNESVNIDLLEGWNIISYPVSIPEDGMSFFNPLITAGSLIKVQDEEGDAIEQNPINHTWFNDIGPFDADEGYKVHVNTPTNLVIDPSDYGSGSSYSLKKKVCPVYATKSTLKSAEAKHFKPNWSGNGTDHMNIYIFETAGGDSGLMPGDEIGIFDGAKCVGSGVISNTTQHYYAFVASSDDPVTKSIDGFTGGNPIAIKLWKSSINREVSIPNPNFFPGTKKVFEAMETSVITLNSADLSFATGDEDGTMLGKIYPNPFRNGTNIPFTLAARTEVSIAVYNIIGQQVNTLVQATLDQGSYNVYWDGTDGTQTGLLPGIYTVKMVAGNKISVERIILMK